MWNSALAWKGLEKVLTFLMFLSLSLSQSLQKRRHIWLLPALLRKASYSPPHLVTFTSTPSFSPSPPFIWYLHPCNHLNSNRNSLPWIIPQPSPQPHSSYSFSTPSSHTATSISSHHFFGIYFRKTSWISLPLDLVIHILVVWCACRTILCSFALEMTNPKCSRKEGSWSPKLQTSLVEPNIYCSDSSIFWFKKWNKRRWEFFKNIDGAKHQSRLSSCVPLFFYICFFFFGSFFSLNCTICVHAMTK